VLSDLTLDDHVLTLAQPFLTTLVKRSGSPFYNHLLTPIFSSKHCSRKQNEEIENEMVECEVHSQDLNEDVDLIDFSEPDEEIQEEIDF
jgi:hypothetical protein